MVHVLAHGRMFNVVLPQAPGFNVGMAAVDLGLLSAAQKLGFEITPWRVGSLADRALSVAPDLDHQMDMGIGPVQLMRDDWPQGLTGPILYWGDFHHMAQYIGAVGRIVGAHSGGHSTALRYLLLDKVSAEIKERSASFGSTLIFNSVSDFMGGDYAQALEDFLSRNSTTFFRDPVSTVLVRRLRQDGAIATGVDPALILEPDQIPEIYPSSGAIGVFFGRSSAARSGMGKIAKRLAMEIDARLEWLDWGDSRGFPHMSLPREIDFVDPPGTESTMDTGSRAMDALSHLASCSAVVTDSYHAALISWRLGIPAVTVTAPVSPVQMSVNSGPRWSWRDKRELAASQYGALDLVVRPEELDDAESLNHRIDHILDLFRGDATMTFIRTQIEDEVEMSLSAFSAQLAVS